MKDIELKIGAKAPQFCLPDKNEKLVCIEDFSDRWLILYFYPKDNTSGCTLEAVEFTYEKDWFDSRGAVIVGISPDSPQSHCKFIDKHNLGIILLSDVQKEVVAKFGVWQLKKMAGREYYGVLRSTFIIDPEGNIAHFWQKVSVKDHIDQVKSKYEELLASK
jgi:peroxiredoxin Q/BCP